MTLFIILALFAAGIALTCYPRIAPALRPRLWSLLLLALPWLAALAAGPLGFAPATIAPERQDWLIELQNLALAASLVLTIALLVWLRGARSFAAAVAALNLMASVAVVSVSTLAIAPGA